MMAGNTARMSPLRRETACGLSLFLFFLFFFPLSLPAQDTIPFRIMFFNVENLFDVNDEPGKNDNEFLPQAIRAWSYPRYKKKLADVARVITAVGEWEPPALVGLCEVENDRVMKDLVLGSPLKEHGYRYVMTDSPDARGIDVALLYQRDKFRLLSHRSVRINFRDKRRVSRDILHVTGMVATRDTVDVFVAHFPSRSGGEKQTETFRIEAALTLRHAIDSILAVRSVPGVILMGDLNDYPDNKSVAQVLGARAPGEQAETNTLYHLLAEKARKKNYGSYKYQGEWGLLDHLIVSGRLLDSAGSMFTSTKKADVVRLPFTLIEDKKYGGLQPFRTYHGMKYQGGYSDHLPVYADFLVISSFPD